jgi:hypothetical protein
MKKKIGFLLLFSLFLIPEIIFCQVPKSQPYPVVGTYICAFAPIVATSDKMTTWNSSSNFNLGFAIGVNALYSDKFGFSFDLSPVINTTKGVSKVSNVIFDPGPIFRLGKGYSIITRLAFETAGRFGESTVISKVFNPGKSNSLLAALGIPVRFGNNLPATIGATLFFGISFK